MVTIRKSQRRSQNREVKIMTKIEKGRLTINFIANGRKKKERRQRRHKISRIFKYEVNLRSMQ